MENILKFIKNNYSSIISVLLLIFMLKTCSEYNSLYYKMDDMIKTTDSITKVLDNIDKDLVVIKNNIEKIKYDKEKIESIYIYDMLLKKREREIEQLKNKFKK